MEKNKKGCLGCLSIFIGLIIIIAIIGGISSCNRSPEEKAADEQKHQQTELVSEASVLAEKHINEYVNVEKYPDLNDWTVKEDKETGNITATAKISVSGIPEKQEAVFMYKKSSDDPDKYKVLHVSVGGKVYVGTF